VAWPETGAGAHARCWVGNCLLGCPLRCRRQAASVRAEGQSPEPAVLRAPKPDQTAFALSRRKTARRAMGDALTFLAWDCPARCATANGPLARSIRPTGTGAEVLLVPRGGVAARFGATVLPPGSGRGAGGRRHRGGTRQPRPSFLMAGRTEEATQKGGRQAGRSKASTVARRCGNYATRESAKSASIRRCAAHLKVREFPWLMATCGPSLRASA
jgi:hypothetical protein